MALLWRGQSYGVNLEVRSAGETRRLYCDGVLHTHYNPTHPLTGDVWDPMALSPFVEGLDRPRKVLMLGLGGGAVAHLLRRYHPDTEVTAIDIDPKRISLGRRFFGLRRQGIELVCADAIEWIYAGTGQTYDLVIDDLFGQVDGQPERAIPLARSWVDALVARLNPGGMLTVNCADKAGLDESALLAATCYRKRFASALRFTFKRSHNHIAVFSAQAMTPAGFRASMRREPALRTARAKKLMRFRVSKIW
ncbi:MAG: methyltransferase domain-containing protein [Myxococcota bacterium]|nr:methyltransferase domain-containing protein [Myxococcota bacterium]